MSVARAIETRDAALLPSRRDEDWRWTDLRGLIRAVPPASPVHDGGLPVGPFAGVEGDEIAIVNGRGPDLLTVAAGETRIAALRFYSGAQAGAHFSRMAITVGEGASLTLLETYETAAADYLVGAEIDISLGQGARLERIVIAADGAEGASTSMALVIMAPEARFAQTLLTHGARRQRLETRVDHPGAGAHARLDGVYLLSDKRHADLTTVVTHAGVGGDTDQLTKGVAADQARGVFQGRIVVSPGADKTDAKMGHHALILSDRAEIDAKPELEIWADDVSCSHGNTVGALDEEALFYARQRGIPEAEARAMLTGAFVGEVVDRIAHDGARAVAQAWVARKLGVAS